MQKTLNIDTASDLKQNFEIDTTFSKFESIVLLFSIIALTAIFVIAAWSGILLVIGRTEGGGPLGMLMNALHIQYLL